MPLFHTFDNINMAAVQALRWSRPQHRLMYVLEICVLIFFEKCIPF